MLNSLKDFKETSIGTKVMQARPVDSKGNVDWDLFDKHREDYPIFIDHDQDMVSFKLMTKPASEGGKGGQLTDLIEVSLHMLCYFNAKFPCAENEMTIHYLNRALAAQEERTKNRVKRGVEGKDVK